MSFKFAWNEPFLIVTDEKTTWSYGVDMTDYQCLQITTVDGAKYGFHIVGDDIVGDDAKKTVSAIPIRELTGRKCRQLETSSSAPIFWHNAKPLLDELNILLSKKCRDLRIVVDYRYNLKGRVTTYSRNDSSLIICLYQRDHCISSITMSMYRDIIYISSRTEREYEGRKYNRLLRAVAILIAPLVKSGTVTPVRIVSEAESAVSVWLLMRYFGGQMTAGDNPDLPEDITDDNLKTYESIASTFARHADLMIMISVALNDTIMKLAIGEFNKLVDITAGELKC
jgi:hypothetical protein